MQNWTYQLITENNNNSATLPESNWNINSNQTKPIVDFQSAQILATKPNTFNSGKPVIWNDFVVLSATANFSNNGESPSTLTLKLIPNKTFYKYKTVKSSLAPAPGIFVQHQDPLTFDQNTNRVRQDNTFTNNDGSTEHVLKLTDAILSPDGEPLFTQPYYTRINMSTSFSFDGFLFSGLITSWKRDLDASGYFYECVITDASEILKSVKLILGSYKGPSNFYNILNVYGLFESTLNSSQSGIFSGFYGRVIDNPAGLPYNAYIAMYDSLYGDFRYYATRQDVKGMKKSHIELALRYLTVLTDGSTHTFGGPIVYGQKELTQQYSLEFNDDENVFGKNVFRTISDDYFYEGNSGISTLYEFLSQLANDAGGDMIVLLRGNKIIPKFIDRKYSPASHVIAQTIDSLTNTGKNVVSSSIGYEAIPQNPTGIMLIGAPKERYFQSSAIRPVYGSYRGVPILGAPAKITITRPAPIGTVVYDVEVVQIPIPASLAFLLGSNFYTATTLEFAIIMSESGSSLWERYLKLFKPALWNVLYLTDGSEIINVQLPKDLNITSRYGIDGLSLEKNNGAVSRDTIRNMLFSTIQNYAENYGKLYAVQLPNDWPDGSLKFPDSPIGWINETPIFPGYDSQDNSIDLHPTQGDINLDPNNNRFGKRRFHYEVVDKVFIDTSTSNSWSESNIYGSFIKNAIFGSGAVTNLPMCITSQNITNFIDPDGSCGPIVEFTQLSANYRNVRNLGDYSYSGNGFCTSIFPDQLGIYCTANIVQKNGWMDPYYIMDGDGRIVSWSELYQAFGYPNDIVPGNIGVSINTPQVYASIDLVTNLTGFNDSYCDIVRGANSSVPFIQGKFAVVELSDSPKYSISKKIEINNFLLYLDGPQTLSYDEAGQLASENVNNFRFTGIPIPPSRIGIPLRMDYDRWVFRSDSEAYLSDRSFKRFDCVGSVELNIDDNLSPQSFGGYQAFFAYADAKLRSLNPQRQSEYGKITFVGTPKGSLGDFLTPSSSFSTYAVNNSVGPSLSGINISFDKVVTTTYEFRNFMPRFGVTSKGYIDLIRIISLDNQKALYSLNKKKNEIFYKGNNSFASPKYVDRYFDRQPPHECLYFRKYNLISPINGKLTTRLYSKSGTEQELLQDLMPNHNNVAIVSWDMILRPYSSSLRSFGSLGSVVANGINSEWNALEDPTSINGYAAASLNSLTLNPLWKGCLVDSLLLKDFNNNIVDIRGLKGFANSDRVTGVGLRGPIVMSGIGFNRHNLQYVGPDYNDPAQNEITHGKAGPIDLSWDSLRKTWSARDNELVYITGLIGKNTNHGYAATAQVINFNNSSFTVYHNIKPVVGKIYLARFVNNVINVADNTSYWVLDPETFVIGTITSSTTITDENSRVFTKNVDYQDPEVTGNIGDTVILTFPLVGGLGTYKLLSGGAGLIKGSINSTIGPFSSGSFTPTDGISSGNMSVINHFNVTASGRAIIGKGRDQNWYIVSSDCAN